jgi:hypothetical protein
MNLFVLFGDGAITRNQKQLRKLCITRNDTVFHHYWVDVLMLGISNSIIRFASFYNQLKFLVVLVSLLVKQAPGNGLFKNFLQMIKIAGQQSEVRKK